MLRSLSCKNSTRKQFRTHTEFSSSEQLRASQALSSPEPPLGFIFGKAQYKKRVLQFKQGLITTLSGLSQQQTLQTSNTGA